MHNVNACECTCLWERDLFDLAGYTARCNSLHLSVDNIYMKGNDRQGLFSYQALSLETSSEEVAVTRLHDACFSSFLLVFSCCFPQNKDPSLCFIKIIPLSVGQTWPVERL